MYRHIFSGDPHCLGKCLEVIGIVVKAAGLAHFIDRIPLAQQDFDRVIRLAVMYLLIVVPVSALKIRQDVGLAQEKMRRKALKRQIFRICVLI